MRKTSAICALLVFLTLSFLVSAIAIAAGDDVPRITIQELKKMVDDKADVTIVDAQPKRAYEKGHIKGALSFPWTPKLNEAQAATLPRTKPIVLYCDCGPGEADSVSIAERLIDLGFSNVKVLQDPSISGWKEAGYPIE
jgi:rhodanese-related sulfurtransferase